MKILSFYVNQTPYVDGTFSYCPKFFKQFFIIHGFVNDFYVPLVFCILKDKFTDTYKQAFSCIKDKVMENYIHAIDNTFTRTSDNGE